MQTGKQHTSKIRKWSSSLPHQFLPHNSIEDPSAATWAWLYPWDSAQLHACFSCLKKPSLPRIKHTSIFIYWNCTDIVKHHDTEHQPRANRESKACETNTLLLQGQTTPCRTREWSKMARETTFRAPQGKLSSSPKHPQPPEQAVLQSPLVCLGRSTTFHRRAVASNTTE